MRPRPLCLLFSIMGCVIAVTAGGAEPVTVELWPEGPPSAVTPKSAETQRVLDSLPPLAGRVTDVVTPSMTVFPAGRTKSPAVVVAPGGGFFFLSYENEGTKVCEWLNSLGITAVLLKYRTPTREEPEQHALPVQDTQRALGIVRRRAEEWNIDPQRVGLLGFSAGAKLAGHAAWDRGDRSYPQDAKLDDPRGPDFLIFIYGGGFFDKDSPGQFKTGCGIPADAPPAIFIVAHDDRQTPAEMARLYLEYKKREIPAELHIYAKGGHGFGMRREGNPANDWPDRVAEWMKSMRFTD